MNEFKIVIEGLKELTDAVNKLASLMVADSTPVNVNAQLPNVQDSGFMNQPQQVSSGQVQPQAGMGWIPIPENTVQQPSASVPVSGTPTMQGTVPTTASVQSFTIEQLQVAAAGLTGMGKMPQVMGILQRFGIQAMTELPKERYGEFALALREAGAQI